MHQIVRIDFQNAFKVIFQLLGEGGAHPPGSDNPVSACLSHRFCLAFVTDFKARGGWGREAVLDLIHPCLSLVPFMLGLINVTTKYITTFVVSGVCIKIKTCHLNGGGGVEPLMGILSGK